MDKSVWNTTRFPISGITDTWPLIMGIVNVTPDSFHDGGRYHNEQTAIKHGRELASAGAAIIDVGGESTRPGANCVSIDVELGRIIPVIRTLATKKITISTDFTFLTLQCKK